MNAHTNKNKHLKKLRPRRARRILRTFHFFDRSEILADNPHSPLPFFSDFIRARIIRDSPLPFSPVQSARISARIFRETISGFTTKKSRRILNAPKSTAMIQRANISASVSSTTSIIVDMFAWPSRFWEKAPLIFRRITITGLTVSSTSDI